MNEDWRLCFALCHAAAAAFIVMVSVIYLSPKEKSRLQNVFKWVKLRVLHKSSICMDTPYP
jgi:hypothetical protein